MKMYIGTDGYGNGVYKYVSEDGIPSSDDTGAERRYLISRKNDAQLQAMCENYEKILEEIYREMRTRKIART